MRARMKMRRWGIGLLVPALWVPVGCSEPQEIVPVAPPGIPLERVPATPQPEAQAVGEQGVTNPVPLPKANSNSMPTATVKAMPTPVGQPTKTGSGLEYVTLKEGTGATAESGQNIVMHYVGTLQDGTKFDSSRDRNEPFPVTIGVGQVIEGWDQGVPGMKVGEVRKLTIPAELAYKGRAQRGIPANSTLIFEVELLGIK